MARIEATADKLVLRHGSTTLTLDKGAGKASRGTKAVALEHKVGRVSALRYRRHRGENGCRWPFRRDHPSQRLTQTLWRDRGSNHGRS